VAAALANSQALSRTISTLQARLHRLPAATASWATLGLAYEQQARITGNPSYYQKATGALHRSMQELRVGNAPALTGRAALAAARHHFGAALRLARQSRHINSYNAVNLAILVDALVELGRYPQAFRSLQRMVNLKPGVPSYTRVSYSYELRGDLAGARYAMRQALEVAYSPDDRAFALFQLGELAWNSGHLGAAARLYAEGSREDTAYIPLLYGQAKVEAARGDTAEALHDWRTVISRFPSPTYVIEYADLLKSLGRKDEARQQEDLIRAQQRLFQAAGVNLDLELALYDANHGRERKALAAAKRAWHQRHSVFVEDAYAWALHVNGHDRAALRHARGAERLGTQSALFAYHRGMIEKSMGMQSAAKSSLQRALAINPYFSPLQAPQASRALAALNSGH
ncbi:MAG: hypothetical protein H0V25_00300, partial [Solirubrobacterales bacterium]|nr:hypothetical protein [Solirubrobacterales bacterium]